MTAWPEQTKFAAAERPRKMSVAQKRSRHIPADVRREVWKRDGGQCAFIGTQGRCSERGFLEFHHVTPYADGGESVVENLELRCRAHNAYEAARWDGTLFAREETPAFFELGLDRVPVGSFAEPKLGRNSKGDCFPGAIYRITVQARPRTAADRAPRESCLA